MKYLLFILCSTVLVVSQAQTSEWLISAGGKHADCGSALATDSNGDIYLAGSFQGEARFNNKVLYSRGDTDIFLAKYTSDGSLVWINKAGSNVTKRNTITEYPTAIRVHGDAVYMTGVFAGIADFNETKVTSKGKEDIFLAKYDLEGELLWVRRAGGSSQDIPNDIVLDANGNVYLTGFFQKTADFGSKQLTALNNREFFIAKYSNNGKINWIKSSNSQSFSLGKVLDVDNQGVIVAGEFAGSTNIDKTELTSNGSTDIFITKYDFEGTPIWTSQHGSDGIDNINAIKYHDSSIYLTGSYLTNGMTNAWQSKGARDGFVSKLSATGDLIWNKTVGGSENDEAIALSIENQQLIIGGKFNAQFEYSPDEIYLSNGFTDIYLLKMDLSGNYVDIKVMGSTGQDFPTSITIKNNEILLTGLFRNQLTTTTSAFGGSDIFLSGIPLAFDHENETKVTYLVYPNPAENDFWIRSESKFNEIELIHEDGRRIEFKEQLNTNEYRFVLSDLPSGIYYVRIDGSSVKKLIIL